MQRLRCDRCVSLSLTHALTHTHTRILTLTLTLTQAEADDRDSSLAVHKQGSKGLGFTTVVQVDRVDSKAVERETESEQSTANAALVGAGTGFAKAARIYASDALDVKVESDTHTSTESGVQGDGADVFFSNSSSSSGSSGSGSGSGSDNRGQASRGLFDADEDTIFQGMSKSAGMPAANSIKVRVSDNSATDHDLADLTTTSGFTEKEDDATLNYDMFGTSSTKQAVQKQNVIIHNSSAAAGVAAAGMCVCVCVCVYVFNRASLCVSLYLSLTLTLFPLLAPRAEADLQVLDGLGMSDDSVLRRRREEKVAAAVAKTAAASNTAVAPAAAAVDIDMASLDLDAYMSANADTSGGGGLFD